MSDMIVEAQECTSEDFHQIEEQLESREDSNFGTDNIREANAAVNLEQMSLPGSSGQAGAGANNQAEGQMCLEPSPEMSDPVNHNSEKIEGNGSALMCSPEDLAAESKVDKVGELPEKAVPLNADQRENLQNLQEFQENLQEVKQELNQVTDRFRDGMQEGLAKLDETKTFIEGVGEIIASSGRVAQEVSQAVGDFGAGIGEMVEGSMGKSGDIPEALGGIVGEGMEAITEISVTTGEAMGEIAGTMIQETGEAIEDLGEAVHNTFEGKLGEGLGDAAKAVKDVGELAVEVPLEAFEGAVEVGREVVEGGVEVIRELSEGVVDLFD